MPQRNDNPWGELQMKQPTPEPLIKLASRCGSSRPSSISMYTSHKKIVISKTCILIYSFSQRLVTLRSVLNTQVRCCMILFVKKWHKTISVNEQQMSITFENNSFYCYTELDIIHSAAFHFTNFKFEKQGSSILEFASAWHCHVYFCM